MLGFGKKKRGELVGKAEKDGLGLILYKCPECSQVAGGGIPLGGHALSDLKKELEITCANCGKEIIVDNRD